MPSRSASARVASEVGTPRTVEAAAHPLAKQLDEMLAVEPVPRPSRMPGLTSSSARAAAARFRESLSAMSVLPAARSGICFWRGL